MAPKSATERAKESPGSWIFCDDVYGRDWITENNRHRGNNMLRNSSGKSIAKFWVLRSYPNGLYHNSQYLKKKIII